MITTQAGWAHSNATHTWDLHAQGARVVGQVTCETITAYRSKQFALMIKNKFGSVPPPLAADLAAAQREALRTDPVNLRRWWWSR
jgi:hypothetical protein